MKKRILAVVMTAAMVLGALTGCGQSSKDDKTESATAAETETISYDVLTQVRVGYMPNYESLWQVATAINKGYFEEEGLDIKLSSFQVGEAGIGLMASGSVDVAYIGTDVHKQCIEGAAQIFCSSLKVSGETADCQGWGCLPGYVEANKDILVRFTKALYKAHRKPTMMKWPVMLRISAVQIKQLNWNRQKKATGLTARHFFSIWETVH